jgi:hypothetical protein
MQIRICLLLIGFWIQLLKMIRIHADPDPQHSILKHIDHVMSIHRMLTCLGRPLRASPASLGPSFAALMSSSLPPSSALPWDFSLTSGSNTPALYWPPSLSIQAQLGFYQPRNYCILLKCSSGGQTGVLKWVLLPFLNLRDSPQGSCL